MAPNHNRAIWIHAIAHLCGGRKKVQRTAGAKDRFMQDARAATTKAAAKAKRGRVAKAARRCLPIRLGGRRDWITHCLLPVPIAGHRMRPVVQDALGRWYRPERRGRVGPSLKNGPGMCGRISRATGYWHAAAWQASCMRRSGTARWRHRPSRNTSHPPLGTLRLPDAARHTTQDEPHATFSSSSWHAQARRPDAAGSDHAAQYAAYAILPVQSPAS